MSRLSPRPLARAHHAPPGRRLPPGRPIGRSTRWPRGLRIRYGWECRGLALQSRAPSLRMGARGKREAYVLGDITVPRRAPDAADGPFSTAGQRERGMPTEKTVLYRREGHIARITLNRPEVLNAEDMSFLADLTEAVHTLRDDREVQGAIVTGAGRAFCAGVDLRALSSGRP